MTVAVKGKPTMAATLTSGAGNILRFGLATLPLFPAIKINLDAAAGQGATWAVVGIGFVIFGALAIEHSLHAVRWRQAITALLWGVLGAGFLALNGMNAIANIASHSDHSRDANRARMQTAAELSRQRDELTERRKEHAKLAGEATPESIEAEIKAAKAANSKLWQASFSCDPAWITKDATRAFCKGIADLEAKKAAATKRDEIDAKLVKLDEKAETKGEAPSTVDSFADAMADGLRAFGYQVGERDKVAIVRARDWGKAIGVEVLAAFGPAALFGLFLRGNAPTPMPKPSVSRVSTPVAVAKPKLRVASFFPGVLAKRKEAEPVVSYPPGSAREFHRRYLEPSDNPNDKIRAGDIQKRYAEDCGRLRIDPLEAKVFSQALQALVQYGKSKGGRPYYHGVKWRDAPLPVAAQQGPRVVVDNTLNTVSGATAAWG